MGNCRGCGCGGHGSGRSDGNSSSCCCSCCNCCNMNGLGIIDGLGMTRYRMTTSSGSGTVGISRGNPSSPSPGTSNDCKPYSSHCCTITFLFSHTFYKNLIDLLIMVESDRKIFVRGNNDLYVSEHHKCKKISIYSKRTWSINF